MHKPRTYHLGNLVDIIVEEAGIGNDSIRRERLDACARGQRAARLVEGQVPVIAHACEVRTPLPFEHIRPLGL